MYICIVVVLLHFFSGEKQTKYILLWEKKTFGNMKHLKLH